jgi:hypothetical protein
MLPQARQSSDVRRVEPPPLGDVAPARSRRSLLTAGLAALGGAMASALGRPAPIEAAAGDSLKLGQQNFAGGAATRLSATSSGGAFWMTQNGSGSGLRGDSLAGHGGVFTSSHADRYGLYAQQLGAAGGTGAAVRAEGGTHPAMDAQSSGIAVRALSTGSYGISSESSGGIAVYGFASSTTGANDAGHFVTWSSYGYGVFARANSDTGTTRGVYGDSYSATGYGVDGYNPYNIGVRGLTSTGSAGVLGQNVSSGDGVQGIAANGWAGYFGGDTRAEGVFQVGGDCAIGGSFSVSGTKSFKIDHPVNPAEQYLLHYCTESSEVLNLYSGTATLDEHGSATVELPAWFEGLNVDVRYQLTAIGSAAPDLHVASEFAKGRFAIAGGRPEQKVSWALTARRNDAWVRANGAPVEVLKAGADRGTYLNPELHGHDASAGAPPLHPIRTPPGMDRRPLDGDVPAR